MKSYVESSSKSIAIRFRLAGFYIGLQCCKNFSVVAINDGISQFVAPPVEEISRSIEMDQLGKFIFCYHRLLTFCLPLRKHSHGECNTRLGFTGIGITGIWEHQGLRLGIPRSEPGPRLASVESWY